MTDDERTKYFNACVRLQRMGVWDHFSDIHLAGASHQEIGDPATAAHRGPAFLPWHRVQIRHFERALHAAGLPREIGCPYWDWTIEGDKGTDWALKQSPLFTDAWFGPSGSGSTQVVKTGRFSLAQGQFRLKNEGPALLRCLGCDGTLPTTSDIANILKITTYDRRPYSHDSRNSFRNALEGWEGFTAHNSVHVWIGGSMLEMSSPNDPLFFMNHCHIDKIWADWQANGHAGTAGYAPASGHVLGHNLADPMFPFAFKVRDTLETTAMGFKYEPSK